MNIKILDSWLRDYLKTKASAYEIAEKLSLTSVSVEKVENYGKDYIYDLEVTTNRPDLFCVVGIARETAAILPQFGIKAEFIPPVFEKVKTQDNIPLKILSDPKLVNRVLAVTMDVTITQSEEEIKKRLETSGIRSLNNVIDITNYVMRVLGHPTHVFDFDRLNTKELLIREARKGEQIETLDNKIYALKGGEIVAINDNNEIVDLLGIMGLANSVVTNETKKILFFIDNNDHKHMRKASMELGIRTEAATLNEKGIDTDIAMDALLFGISLFKNNADAKNISSILDIYPNKQITRIIPVSIRRINTLVGVNIDIRKSQKALEALGFKTNLKTDVIEVLVPSFRVNDIEIEEDVIEEIARIYGYHNLPSIIPPISDTITPYLPVNEFYWEKRVKQAMKYFGFTECYTYSFVSENMFEGPLNQAVEIVNPLTSDFIYMRNTIIPSLLEVVSNNKQFQELRIFEIANIYKKNENDLPFEKVMFAGVLKKEKANFYEVKGLIEQVLYDLGIDKLTFKPSDKGGIGASIFIENDYLGEIEILDTTLIDFELDFSIILKFATNRKKFKHFAKYPPIVEDLTIVVDSDISTEKLIDEIQTQSKLITEVGLKDTYENSRTFHIVFQDFDKNLTKEDAAIIRNKIISSLKATFNAKFK